MPRISLNELEEAKNNPALFRRKIESRTSAVYGPSYFGSLRDAIFSFHKWNEDTARALTYLEGRLDRFKDRQRVDDIIDQFLWYVDEFDKRGWSTFQTRLNIEIPLSEPAPRDLKCSGQVSRVDIVPSGGYVAWLFRSRDHRNWSEELQMRLIQQTLSRVTLSCPLNEVGIGLYSFQERYVAYRYYSSHEIQNAQTTLRDLVDHMGY